jgi:methionyl-tRNA formyltransferase
LLPKYRGAAPIAWAIANGETTTGLTTMQIDAGMDTGPTLLQHELKVGAAETAPDVSQRMAKAGAPLIVQSLRQLDRGEIAPKPQDSSQATYAPLLKKEHGRIDWQLPARQIHDRMRGFAPWPGAFTVFRDHVCHLWGRPAESALAADTQPPGTIIAVGAAIYVVCGEGSCLELEGAQLEDRKRVTPREFANGARLTPGERFGGASA